MNERFQRTLGILSEEHQAMLHNAHILIAGVGGAGGQLALDLTRMGIGHITLADFDVYEIHNTNRQAGCFNSTLGQSKIDVIARMCQDVHPDVVIHKEPQGITLENVERLVGNDGRSPVPLFVVEVIDLAGADAKIALHRACREQGIHVLTGTMLGFGAALWVFPPDAPGYEEIFVKSDGKLDIQRLIPRLGSYAIVDYVERCLQGTGHAPTCVVGATTASALMVTEIVRGVLLGTESMVSWPDHIYVDYFDRVFQAPNPDRSLLGGDN